MDPFAEPPTRHWSVGPLTLLTQARALCVLLVCLGLLLPAPWAHLTALTCLTLLMRRWFGGPSSPAADLRAFARVLAGRPSRPDGDPLAPRERSRLRELERQLHRTPAADHPRTRHD